MTLEHISTAFIRLQSTKLLIYIGIGNIFHDYFILFNSSAPLFLRINGHYYTKGQDNLHKPNTYIIFAVRYSAIVIKMIRYILFSIVLLAVAAPMPSMADDGASLWLRAKKTIKAGVDINRVYGKTNSPTLKVAEEELLKYWKGGEVTLRIDPKAPLGEGFRISEGNTVTARTPIGLLYGVYELLRCQETRCTVVSGDYMPAFPLRILNHWDNPDGSVERGYAGRSIFKWDEIKPTQSVNSRRASLGNATYSCTPGLRQRLTDYARANASVGINGIVVNNVNASPDVLSSTYLNKLKAVADVVRPYGIRVYLSVNFASPIVIGKLPTADPLDDGVAKWWGDKAKEIYQLVPDFGGFLVKANSEGQPGPGDYGRSHAEGANMLADALKPYGGIVMWRCFVYGNRQGEDRVKQAVEEFKPLDGLFRDNVILQAKQGPLDFQPREPYSPVFDQIVKTPLMAEMQITQEYLGQSVHLVYLAPMWKEFFSFVDPSVLRGVAGVANIGDDANWCGHHFSQANWYAFGRLAWNPSLTSDSIAKEWLRQTFLSNTPNQNRWQEADTAFVAPMAAVMEGSRESCVKYMMPLGLHHLFRADHHYGPQPDLDRDDLPVEWRSVYYHKADTMGIGFNRSRRGTNAVSQYREPYATIYNNVDTCPEEYLLWFHHLPWSYMTRSGRTLWEEMRHLYDEGVGEVEHYIEVWHAMKPYVDQERYEDVERRLAMQLDNAKEWRAVCLDYFGKMASH